MPEAPDGRPAIHYMGGVRIPSDADHRSEAMAIAIPN
jgi:hypothetical protein